MSGANEIRPCEKSGDAEIAKANKAELKILSNQ